LFTQATLKITELNCTELNGYKFLLVISLLNKMGQRTIMLQNNAHTHISYTAMSVWLLL